ncbi:MAG TPA: AlkA N-terminal domain-containing protein [Burkholderiales bacterium]|nr:AlkA N-terminal domain-containing protein [Burkholderiales bacterium]
MQLDQESCYQALASRDARFDGLMFVGVSSTGIYCRLICNSRRPLRRNCTFYPNAAAAEQAGYRPCLRCRPELAPGNALVDSRNRLAVALGRRIEDGALNEMDVPSLAAEMGISDRHLRRVIQDEFGVSPNKLLETQRLLTAKLLLTDTSLPVTEVAFASGFSSLRRFNDAFKTNYRLNPTGFRRSAASAASGRFVCELAYRPPLDWDCLLEFLSKRLYGGVEAIRDSSYLRTVSLGGCTGWIRVRQSTKRHALTVELAPELGRAIPTVLTRVRRLFDLGAEPQRIALRLGKLAARQPGLRLPGAFDGFEVAVRAVLGQQISVKAATTLAGRFATAFGEPVDMPFSELRLLMPTAERVARAAPAALAKIGVTSARSRTLSNVARAMVGNPNLLDPGADVGAALSRIKEIPGIGEWTAQYLAMRAFAWPDAFPATDLGIRKALGTEDERKILTRAEAWRPWRGYAAMHLWRTLT